MALVQSWPVKAFLKFYFWGLFRPLFERTAEGLYRKRGWKRGNDMQQRATEWNQTWGCCSEDTASVYEAPSLPTEPQGRPSKGHFKCLKQVRWQRCYCIVEPAYKSVLDWKFMLTTKGAGTHLNTMLTFEEMSRPSDFQFEQFDQTVGFPKGSRFWNACFLSKVQKLNLSPAWKHAA